MPALRTPRDLGLSIRTRRKALGWDQATLAQHVGVTRQWVIDIEKGKPRAELGLALKALQVLGLTLRTEPTGDGGRVAATKKSNAAASVIDLDRIIQDNRSAAARLAVDPLPYRPPGDLVALAYPGKFTTAADQMRALPSASRLAEHAHPGKTAKRTGPSDHATGKDATRMARSTSTDAKGSSITQTGKATTRSITKKKPSR